MQEQEPIIDAIVINPNLYRMFMKTGKDFHNLIAMYLFYTYNAQHQKTNQPYATDKFAQDGLGWGLEKVKRIKALLKKIGVIKMVRKGYFTYVQVVYIYTKRKVEEILENAEVYIEEPQVKVEPKPEPKIIKVEEVKEIEPERTIEEIVELLETNSPMVEELEESGIESKKAVNIRNNVYDVLTEKSDKIYEIDNSALIKWISYCENNSIKYSKNNIRQWIQKLDGELIVEQFQSVNKAIYRKWKNFYSITAKESDYQRFLGRNIKLNEIIHIGLKDIYIEDKRAIYQFEDGKQIRANSQDSKEIVKLFEMYEDV